MIIQKRFETKNSWEITFSQIGVPQQSITIPGQALNLRFAMEQFKKGSLIERAKGFYETQGLEMPDFNSMSKIERLQQLSDFRKQTKELEEKLTKLNNDALEKQEKAKGRKSSDSDQGQPDAK